MTTDDRSRYCGRRCKRRGSPSRQKRETPCVDCGTAVLHWPGAAPICRPCRTARRTIAKTCPQCGTAFEVMKTQDHKVYCSRVCVGASQRVDRPTTNPRHWPKFNQRGRVVTAQTGARYEVIHRWRVYDRDDWQCAICELSIDRSAAWPDLMCASADHTVPLAMGGDHTYANVQAAHWLCNVRKNARELAPAV